MNRIKSKVGWIIKRRKLKEYGKDSHVGYGLTLKNPQNISIGDRFNAGMNLIIETWEEYHGAKFTPRVIIDQDVSIMDNCQISCAKEISIGAGTLFGSNVFITDNFHGSSTFENLNVQPKNRSIYI